MAAVKEDTWVAQMDVKNPTSFILCNGPMAQRDAKDVVQKMATGNPGVVFVDIKIGTPVRYKEVKTFQEEIVELPAIGEQKPSGTPVEQENTLQKPPVAKETETKVAPKEPETKAVPKVNPEPTPKVNPEPPASAPAEEQAPAKLQDAFNEMNSEKKLTPVDDSINELF